MQLLNGGFNANSFDPAQGGSQFPIGRHVVQVSGSAIKPTQDQTSGFLELKCIIQDGAHAGTECSHRFNIYHKDDQPRNIAERQLSAVCHVTGIMELHDTEQLHGQYYIVDVGMQKEPNPKGYTQVNKVYDVNGNEPMKGKVGPQPGNGQQQAPQGQQQGGFGQPNTQQQPAQQPQNQGQQFTANVPVPDANQGQQQAPAQQNGGQQWGNQGQQQNTQQAPAQQQAAPAWGQQQAPQGGGNAPAWGQARQ